MKYVSLFLLLISSYAFAQLDIRGHHRIIGSTFYGTGEYENGPYYGQLAYNSRLIALYKTQNWTSEFAYEFFTSYNRYENRDLQSNLEDNFFRYRVNDIDRYLIKHKLYDQDSYQWFQNLDRLYTTYSNENVKATVGRQVIGFGSARTVNPLDILVPFNFLMINLEQKTGVDAIRVTVPTGEMADIDFGEVFSKNISGNQQFKFLSYGDSLNGLDYKLLYMSLLDHTVLGLDLQGSIFDWGVWLEYGSFNVNNNDQNFSRYSLGGQYFFANELNFFGEYHYNGMGTKNPRNYRVNASKSYQKDFAVYLVGRNYFNFGGSYPYSPLKTILLTFYNNLDDGSALLAPEYEYNFAQDWYGTVGAFVGVGRKLKDLKTYSSEFGEYPKALFVTVKKFI